MTESKIRKLNPRKLEPPKEIQDRLKKREFEGKMRNPIFRFFFLFFGEGL